MKKTIHATRSQSQESDSDNTQQFPGKIILPTKIVTLDYSFEKKEHSWFVNSDIPTDLSIQVEEITFYVHKYTLLSKSGYIGRVELQLMSSDLGYNIKLENFPGGPATFEVVLKFCYGLPLDLSPNNVAPLRCASEFLEMTEEFEEGNLISKTEAFLTFIVLAAWRDSIIVLKTCENLSPWAENLQIVRRCCDSISWKAIQGKKTTGESNDDEDWWFDDVATLHIDHFIRVIAALKAKGIKPETLGFCIMHYAEKWLPSIDGEVQGQREHWYGKNGLQLSIVSGKDKEGNIGQNKERKMIIESLISVLPPQKEVFPCKFLLWMLKVAMIYSATPALVSELEKRVGLVLQDANVQELLMPNFGNRDQEKLINWRSSPEERTMHNTDTVQRIVEYFLIQQKQHQSPQIYDVSKLLDNYLAEIAKDPNLTISKFQVFAELLPENARKCHDGLYRAIDTYLKSHPSLPEHDRKRLCKMMNCEKLSIDACMHVAQNDRLPMKTVVQVLFSEQVKMRTAMEGKEQTTNGDNFEDDESWSCAKREIKTLKIDLEKVKEKLSELHRDYSELQREYEKLINKQQSTSGWMSGWKKIKKSSLFNGKVEAEESGEGHERFNQGGNRVNLRRRQSIS